MGSPVEQRPPDRLLKRVRILGIQFLVVFLVVLLPTVLMGMTFPCLAAHMTRRVDRFGTGLGTLYAWNTVGAIAGSVAAGFLLVPSIGAYRTLTLAIGGNVLLGATILLRRTPSRQWVAYSVQGAFGAPLLLFPPWDRRLMDSGVFHLPKLPPCMDALIGSQSAWRGSRPGDRGRSVYVYGVTHDIMEIMKLRLRAGRFWPESDPRRGSPVAVLGPTLARELFGDTNPLGASVRIAGTRFRVSGLLDPKGQMLGVDLDDIAYIPVASVMRIFNLDELFEIDLIYANASLAPGLQKGVKRVLTARHDGNEDFTVTTQAAMMEVFGNVMDVVTMAVGAIAGISLLVGATGILTMMWIAVVDEPFYKDHSLHALCPRLPHGRDNLPHPRWQQSAITQSTHHYSYILGETISNSIAMEMSLGRSALVQETLEQAGRESSQIRTLRIFNLEGQVLRSIDRAEIGQRIDLSPLRGQFKDVPTVFEHRREG